MNPSESQLTTPEGSNSSHGFSDLGEEMPVQQTPEHEEPVQQLPMQRTPVQPTPQVSNSVKASTADDDDCSKLDDFTMGSRTRARDPVVLKLDGSNYNEWKVLLSASLDADPFALYVTMGRLVPPLPTAKTKQAMIQRRKYEAGNRAARCILFSSLQPALASQRA